MKAEGWRMAHERSTKHAALPKDRFQTDKLIRQQGYTIHSRPRKGEPLWVKDGVVQAQSEILRSLGK